MFLLRCVSVSVPLLASTPMWMIIHSLLQTAAAIYKNVLLCYFMLLWIFTSNLSLKISFAILFSSRYILTCLHSLTVFSSYNILQTSQKVLFTSPTSWSRAGSGRASAPLIWGISARILVQTSPCISATRKIDPSAKPHELCLGWWEQVSPFEKQTWAVLLSI